MRATYNDNTSFVVRTCIEVATPAEATEIAELWIEENGGSATVHRKRGHGAFARTERIATFGTRS